MDSSKWVKLITPEIAQIGHTVFFRGPQNINLGNGCKAMLSDIRETVVDRNLSLVVEMQHERLGYMDGISRLLREQFGDNYILDKTHFISGNNLSALKYYGSRLLTGRTIVGPFCLKLALRCLEKPEPRVNIIDKNVDFIVLNRCLRAHRIHLMALMSHYRLIDDNYVSFFKNAHYLKAFRHYRYMVASSSFYGSKEERDFIMKEMEKLPDEMRVDAVPDPNSWSVLHTLDAYYEQSMFSVITESEYMRKGIRFTEKTYRPIILKHPFLMVGQVGMLRELRSMGFETFGKWFDESYDEIEDGSWRVRCVVEEMSRLSALDIETKRSMLRDMMPVLEHNRNVIASDPYGFIYRNSNICDFEDWIEGL